MNPDDQAIHDLHSTWINAVNTGDLPRLLTLMADDVLFLSPGKPPFGRDHFSANFTAAHQTLRIHCQSDLQEVVIIGQVAYTRSRDTLSLTLHASREPTQFAGDRLTNYRQQPNARWLMARDAHTLSSVEKLRS